MLTLNPGGLEHPGIVPVYGLGTYGDGRPYYAMRFIKGDSLKEAIEQFHQNDLTPALSRRALVSTTAC
jgi:serine/threonine protein kinase